MKVKISDYPDRLICNIHSKYMDKKYNFGAWEQNNNNFERFLEWLEDKIQSFYNLLNWLYFDRKWQKIKVKIDPWDTWGMDETLSHIILPMLKQLKETKHGAPYTDDEDVPENLRSTSTDLETRVDNTIFKRWDWILDEMIWAFEQKVDNSSEDKFFTWGNDEITSYDKEGHKKYLDRKSNGFRLFGKYYESLWD